jgi:hypothetical protein
MTHPHFYEINEQYKGDKRHFNTYHLTFSLRLNCQLAYNRLSTRKCYRKYNDLHVMFINIIPNVCKIHSDRNRRQRSKCGLLFRNVKIKICIRSDNHTTQINNIICVRFKPFVYIQFIYSRTSDLFSVLTTVYPLVYAQS